MTRSGVFIRLSIVCVWGRGEWHLYPELPESCPHPTLPLVGHTPLLGTHTASAPPRPYSCVSVFSTAYGARL